MCAEVLFNIHQVPSDDIHGKLVQKMRLRGSDQLKTVIGIVRPTY